MSSGAWRNKIVITEACSILMKSRSCSSTRTWSAHRGPKINGRVKKIAHHKISGFRGTFCVKAGIMTSLISNRQVCLRVRRQVESRLKVT